MRHWYLSLCMGDVLSAGWIETVVSIQPPEPTPPLLSDKYQCRIDTAIFSWWWLHGCPKHLEKRNKYIKQNCKPSWTCLQDYTEMHGQKTPKKLANMTGLSPSLRSPDVVPYVAPAAWHTEREEAGASRLCDVEGTKLNIACYYGKCQALSLGTCNTARKEVKHKLRTLYSWGKGPRHLLSATPKWTQWWQGEISNLTFMWPCIVLNFL